MDMLRSNCYDHLIRNGAKLVKDHYTGFYPSVLKTTSKWNADVRVTGKDLWRERRALREGHKNTDQEQY